MCDDISWVEIGNGILFLSDDDLASTRGQELLQFAITAGDFRGHGAIRAYYAKQFSHPLRRGANREMSDFSSPTNFPPEIVEAIKGGRMTRCHVAAWEQLLTSAACEEAIAAYEEAGAAFDKARAAYDKARAAFDKARAAFEEARAAYEEAWDAYMEARAARDKAWDAAGWRLFANAENRMAAWR